jgi:hypothetical protein
MTRQEPTCFVIMPFGEKVDVNGTVVDFDSIYEHILTPAITAAGCAPYRADHATEGGFIHRKMIEHIHRDPVAVVDISLLNPNVFYELGVRHTLRQAVTVLVRRRGTTLPFNISNLSVIEYDETDPKQLALATRSITTFISNGLAAMDNDSLVYEVLDIRIQEKTEGIKRSRELSYRFKEVPGRQLCLRTGEIARIKDIDIWVNSENTDMQMARYHDFSISSVIRYLGAEKDATGHVIEDKVNNALLAAMDGNRDVAAGTVIPTTAGALEHTHHVHTILHVAAVDGQPGRGYRPVADLAGCVTNALDRVDSDLAETDCSSILIPLLGIGMAPDRLREIVDSLLEAAVAYVMDYPETVLERICFLAWSEAELAACQASLRRFDELEPASAEPDPTQR